MFSFKLKKKFNLNFFLLGGAWLAQVVKHATLDLRGVEITEKHKIKYI